MEGSIHCDNCKKFLKHHETHGETRLAFFCDQQCADNYEERQLRSGLRRDLLDTIEYAELDEDVAEDVVRVVRRLVGAKQLFEKNIKVAGKFLAIERDKVQFRQH